MNKIPIVFHPNYNVKVVGGSRFPTQKYQYLKKLLEMMIAIKLLEEMNKNG